MQQGAGLQTENSLCTKALVLLSLPEQDPQHRGCRFHKHQERGTASTTCQIFTQHLSPPLLSSLQKGKVLFRPDSPPLHFYCRTLVGCFKTDKVLSWHAFLCSQSSERKDPSPPLLPAPAQRIQPSVEPPAKLCSSRSVDFLNDFLFLESLRPSLSRKQMGEAAAPSGSSLHTHKNGTKLHLYSYLCLLHGQILTHFLQCSDCCFIPQTQL